ncbi:DUF4136 domain-containing protein [Shewanella sp. Scap07]|uniref:DUF4136 domain-containing protein n=1 Tax=Shewanella sp. Scap07 TaxID=2589987 RepID=UPI0015BA1755|nr:DUF4136 domain-containing protein [Shewanella sp. Scap07]QLE85843.1 DUF4136 domain-containing protein [Shewanella sp. Scap07]
MMKKCIAAAILMLTVGCATQESVSNPLSRTTMVTSGDISLVPQQKNTYAWHPSVDNVMADERIDQVAVKAHMQQAINEVMSQKGYQLVSLSSSPAMLIGYGLALEAEMSDAEIMKRAGLVPGLSTQNVDHDKYEKGSVLIAVFNPHQIQPIWRVLAQGFTDFEQSGEQRQARFDQLLGKMMQPIPHS